MFLNANSRKLSLSSKLCKQYLGKNDHYNNLATAATFTLSSLPLELLQQVAVLNVGCGMEEEAS